jgi:hypothetical protein
VFLFSNKKPKLRIQILIYVTLNPQQIFMATSEIITKFNFSYAELLQQALEKQVSMTRDVTDLTPRGVDAVRVAKFDTLIVEFQDTTPDRVMVGNITIAVSARDAARDALIVACRDVADVARMALKNKPGAYETFDYQASESMDPSEFLLWAENLCDRADVYINDLSPSGITQAAVDAIRADLAAFQTKIKGVIAAKKARDLNTAYRRTVANILYDEMSDIADIGKVYYQDRDEAKYNDYIIYASSETSQLRSGRLAAGITKSRPMEAITPETEILASNEGTAPIEIYFAQIKDEASVTKKYVLPPFEKAVLICGKDLGFDDSTSTTIFTLHNPSTTDEVIYRMRIE